MAHQVEWTENVYEQFCKRGMLTSEECWIMKTRIIDEMPISIQAYKLNCSKSRIERKIKKLRKKYDAVQKEYPDIFPKRKRSKREKWLDTH